VVLTAAMRPATALSADGPQNLFDAITVARHGDARGVLAVLGGTVYAGVDLRKVHGYAVAAFSAGDAGALAVLEAGVLRRFRAWPEPSLHAAASALPVAAAWPVVDIVASHTQARGGVIGALVAAGAQGLVIAGTGNGSVHHGLLQAAREAAAAGVPVRRASRCQLGGVVAMQSDELPGVGPLTAAQARIELMLDLMLR
jgi:L-asparaginase